MNNFTEQMIAKYIKRLYRHNMPTFLHSLRVGDMLYHFSQHLGLENLEQIYFLGVLHDIGKLEIPTSLLDKKGKLTPNEFEELKRHTLYGRDIFLSLHHLPPEYATCVLYHHENFSGNGYYHRKGREEIPFLSRLIRIVDTYDTMLYGRIYQKAINQDIVIKEILALKGLNFDPNLVDEFIEMLSGKYLLNGPNLLEVYL